MKIDWKKMIMAILICQFAGIIGSFFTSASVTTWYATLSKPFFSPPNWVFGPVWITLYTLMGISLYLIWKKRNNILAVNTFYLQLGLNAIWSIIFFGLKNPALALFEIIILLIALFATIVRFYLLDKNAAYLLYPYLLWGLFASLLNFNIMLLN